MTMLNVTRLQAIVAVMFTLTFSIARADDWQLPDLMRLLAQNKADKATFIEKKFIGILDRPVKSSGELAFTAPDKLEKRTLKPKPELLLLEGDSLTIDQPGKRRYTFSLQEHPEISAFTESIRGTLAGDLPTLEKYYKLQMKGSADEWQLVLIPTQASMIKVISSIRISGSNADVKSIVFSQSDGDRSEMFITKVITP
jgi:hypothetical protein